MNSIKDLLFASLLLLLCGPGSVTSANAQERVAFPHGSLEIISDHAAISAGKSFSLGIHFILEEGWHVYWKNPGDTGLPTSVQWNLPQDFKASALNWPIPKRIQFGEYVNFGYENEVLFFSEIETPKSLIDGAVASLTADLKWVLCNDECNPGSAQVAIELPCNTNLALLSEKAALFSQARSRLPNQSMQSEMEIADDSLQLHFSDINSARDNIKSAIFFPESSGLIDTHTAPTLSYDKNGSLLLKFNKDADFTEHGSASLNGLLALQSTDPESAKVFSIIASKQTSSPLPNSEADPRFSLFFTLCSAFLGGLILNLMPCVFPVISIKILGFVHSAGSKRAPLHGLAFSAGVLFSFWFLACSLLLLRAGGSEIGWGFQFQSPKFVAFMAYLVFAIGLNLAGVFEVGGRLQTVAGKLDRASGLGGSLISGMLATLLATPCTAPFMASALGLALGLPAIQAFAIFTAVGIGMSTPYLILPLFPRALRFLPRPGDWLVGFKQLLSFPMFATATWLTWVLAQQIGANQLMTFIFGLLPLSFGLWIYGRWAAPHRSLYLRRTGALIAIALIVFTWSNSSPSNLAALQTPCLSKSSEAESNSKISWEEFSQNRLETLLQNKHAVLIDFSAAWCLTCQVNHKIALSSPEVANQLRAKGVTAMQGDWTARDPKITEAIRSYGRAGVPLTVLLIPGQLPKILPSVFSAADLINLLNSVDSTPPIQLAFQNKNSKKLLRE